MVSVKEITQGNNKLIYKINNTIEITQIILTFNKTNQVQGINPSNGSIIGSFANSDNLNEILGILTILLRGISTNNKINANIKFKFIVNNKKEEEQVIKIVEAIKRHSFNNVSIEYSEEYKKNIKKETPKETNKIISEETNNLTASGSKEIIKHGPNDEIQKFIELDGKIYDNNDNLSINEKKQQLLLEWMNDPLKNNQISSLTSEELDRLLTESITQNLKTHYLNDTSQTNIEGKNQEQANIANEIAQEYDGKVNTELGIIQKGADNYNEATGNEFKIVEENNNGYTITEPTTNKELINANEINSVSYSASNNNYNYQNQTDIVAEDEELTNRVIDGEYKFLIDENDYIYTQEQINEPIGRIGDEQGYSVDESDNLYKNNELIGKVEKKKKDKTLTRTKKLDGYITFLLFSIIMSLMFVIYIVITLV